MSKVLIASDAHIFAHKKSNERLQDCLNVLEWILDTAKERKVNNILFAGDLFHERSKIEIETYQRTFEILEKKLQANLYLLLGNHDLWHNLRTDISSVIPFRALKGIKIIDKPCTLNIDNHPVSFLPYTQNPIEDLKKIENADYQLLLGHVAVDGAVWNRVAGLVSEVSVEQDGEMTKISPEIFSNWKQVFLGHYHAEQKLLPNVEYIGSPLQLSFGEAFQHKHIIIYDLDTGEKEYIRNTFSPQYFIIPAKDINKYDLNNNFIRVMVDDMSAGEVIEMRKEIMAKNKVGFLGFQQVEKSVEEETGVMEEAKAILEKGDEMLRKYVSIQKDLELNKEKLLSVGKKICEGN